MLDWLNDGRGGNARSCLLGGHEGNKATRSSSIDCSVPLPKGAVEELDKRVLQRIVLKTDGQLSRDIMAFSKRTTLPFGVVRK